MIEYLLTWPWHNWFVIVVVALLISFEARHRKAKPTKTKHKPGEKDDEYPDPHLTWFQRFKKKIRKFAHSRKGLDGLQGPPGPRGLTGPTGMVGMPADQFYYAWRALHGRDKTIEDFIKWFTEKLHESFYEKLAKEQKQAYQKWLVEVNEDKDNTIPYFFDWLCRQDLTQLKDKDA